MRNNWIDWLFIVAIVGMLLTGGYILVTDAPKACAKYGEVTEQETRFDRRAGCFVKVNGRWRHLNELRWVPIE